MSPPRLPPLPYALGHPAAAVVPAAAPAAMPAADPPAHPRLNPEAGPAAGPAAGLASGLASGLAASAPRTPTGVSLLAPALPGPGRSTRAGRSAHAGFSGAPGPSRLREAAQPVSTAPGMDQAGHAGHRDFMALPVELRSQIGLALEPGSGDGARLAGVNRQLALEMRLPALADRLAARLRAMQHGDAQAIDAILEQAAVLPDLLRAKVYGAAIAAVGNAAEPEADFGPLLEKLRCLIATLQPHSLRLQTTDVLLHALATGRFVELERTPAMASFHHALGMGLDRLPRNGHGARRLALWIAGLYLAAPEPLRMDRIRKVIDKCQQQPPALRASLLGAAAFAIQRMPYSTTRHTHCFMLLEQMGDLAPPASLALISILADTCLMIEHPVTRATYACALVPRADALPAPANASAWAMIVDVVPTLPRQTVHHLLDHLLARLKQCPPASGPAFPLALACSVGGLVTTRDETRVWSAVQAHAATARENDRAAIQAVLAASLHRLNPQIGDERFHELLGGLHEIRPALRSAPAAQLAQQIQILPSSSARAAALSQILWLMREAPDCGHALLANLAELLPTLTGKHEAPLALRMILSESRRLSDADRERLLMYLSSSLPSLSTAGSLSGCARLILAECRSMPAEAAQRLDQRFWFDIDRAIRWVGNVIDSEPDDLRYAHLSSQQMTELIALAATAPPAMQAALQHTLAAVVMHALRNQHPMAHLIRQEYINTQWQPALQPEQNS